MLVLYEKLFNFSDLIGEIFEYCLDHLQQGSYDKNSEIKFSNSVEEIYFQIQNYFNEEP